MWSLHLWLYCGRALFYSIFCCHPFYPVWAQLLFVRGVAKGREEVCYWQRWSLWHVTGEGFRGFFSWPGGCIGSCINLQISTKIQSLLPIELHWLNIPVTILLYLVTHLGFILISFMIYLVQIRNSLQWGLDIVFTYGIMSTVMYQINISEC